MARVLFVYPNVGNSLRIPLGISILTACLRNRGHEVRIFDPTFMRRDYGRDYKLMESRQIVKKTDVESVVGAIEEKDIGEEVKSVLSEFFPDFVAVSLIERNYAMFREILSVVRETQPELPVLVGGILPSIYPEMLLEEPLVDYICVGEGEKFIVDFADNFADPEKLKGIPGLWIKNGEEVHKNPLGALTDMAEVPFQEWEGFDPRQLLKPYEGKIYRGGSFEFSRGCFRRCSFCVAPKLRGVYGEGVAGYHRTKKPERLVEEIAEKKARYGLEMNAFCDTDFLSGLRIGLVETFSKLYKKEVNLPFTIQTSAEAISEEKLKLIADAGCVTISIGVESGSPRIRSDVLLKKARNERIQKSFDLCRKYSVRTTANYMVGLPFETPEDAQATLEFNRKLNPPSIAITYFQPFLGTELYNISVKAGFYKGFDPKASVYRESPLQMPQLPPDQIQKFVEDFVDDFNSWKTEGYGENG